MLATVVAGDAQAAAAQVVEHFCHSRDRIVARYHSVR